MKVLPSVSGERWERFPGLEDEVGQGWSSTELTWAESYDISRDGQWLVEIRGRDILVVSAASHSSSSP